MSYCVAVVLCDCSMVYTFQCNEFCSFLQVLVHLHCECFWELQQRPAGHFQKIEPAPCYFCKFQPPELCLYELLNWSECSSYMVHWKCLIKPLHLKSTVSTLISSWLFHDVHSQNNDNPIFVVGASSRTRFSNIVVVMWCRTRFKQDLIWERRNVSVMMSII